MFQLTSLLSAFLLCLSWLVSTHYLPWVTWHSEAVAFLAVLVLGSGAVIRALRGSRGSAIALPSAFLPLVGLVAVVGLQRATGLIPFWGVVWTFSFYVALCMTCLVVGFAAASPSKAPGERFGWNEPFTALAVVIVFGAAASSVIAFAQVFSLWEHSDWIARTRDLRRPGGNLAQPNHLATLLVMGTASSVFLYQSKRFGAAALVLLLLFLGVGIAATESRTGALSVLALLGWWLLKRRAIGDTTRAWVGVGICIAFLAMFSAWPHLLNAMDLSQGAEGRMLEGSLRFQVWPQLLEALAMRPWTGWGFHQVAAALNSVADGYSISEPYTYSHNLLLDLALWFGVPLGLLLIGTGALWLWRRSRAANGLLPWYGIATALPLLLHSMLEFPHAYAYFLAPVMFLIGAIEASTGVKPLARVSAKPVAFVLLMITMALCWSAVEYLRIEEDFRAARFQALRIGSPSPENQRVKIIVYDQLDLLLDATRITPSPDMSPDAIRMVKEAALHYPWSATQYRYVLALALNGNPVEAVRQMEVIRLMWGEKVYGGVKKQIAELAETKYPELRALSAP